jgi:hypothetical protein
MSPLGMHMNAAGIDWTEIPAQLLCRDQREELRPGDHGQSSPQDICSLGDLAKHVAPENEGGAHAYLETRHIGILLAAKNPPAAGTITASSTCAPQHRTRPTVPILP